MRTCLSDEALVLLHYGEGAPPERDHLASCLGCAARAQDLRRDLAALGDALGQAPRGHAPARPRRVAAVAAVLLGLALLAAGQAGLWRVSGWVAAPRAGLDVETVTFLEDVAAVLAAEGDGSGSRLDAVDLAIRGERSELFDSITGTNPGGAGR